MSSSYVLDQVSRWMPDHKSGYTVNHLFGLLGEDYFTNFTLWMDLDGRQPEYWADEPVFAAQDVNDWSEEMYVLATRRFIDAQPEIAA